MNSRESCPEGPTRGTLLMKNAGEPKSLGRVIHCIGSRAKGLRIIVQGVAVLYAVKFAHVAKKRRADLKIYDSMLTGVSRKDNQSFLDLSGGGKISGLSRTSLPMNVKTNSGEKEMQSLLH